MKNNILILNKKKERNYKDKYLTKIDNLVWQQNNNNNKMIKIDQQVLL